ncbi:MAG: M3 family metallopeptidase [Bacteroidales bacterium]|nr:M3 family metallopeptidase [Bacteroidales bacterium]
MNFKTYSAMALSTLMMVGCAGNKQEHQNPLFVASDAKYGIEKYDQITAADFREAILLGMQQQNEAIAAIVACAEEPTFANTIEAYDQSDAYFDKVSSIFSCISSSNSTEELRALQTELQPILSAHGDAITFNKELFARIKKVYDMYYGEEKNAEAPELTHEQMTCLKKVYKSFAKSGAELNDEQKEKLAALNLEIGKLQLQFRQNLLHETNNTFVTVDTREELAGLPEANIEAAAKMAKEQGQEGKYMFNMQRPSCNPVLQFCSNRDVRKKVYDAYYNRGNQGNEWDNKAISAKLVKLRLERAKLFGYNSAAEQILSDRMAKNSENVYNLLDQVWKPAVAKANEELADIRVEMKKDGLDCEPEGWDYMYYSSRAKAAKFAIDEAELAQYFEINNVLKGIFYVANKLHGLTFKEITGQVPTYEPTAQTWEVYKDGELYSIFYNDYFPRESKGAGAWMSELRSQNYDANGRTINIVQNVCNMTAPTGDGPALQNMDNVETMFHEFGHAMHYMLHDVKYRHCYNVERDFVELPSQINEHWATEPEVLEVYAKHYQTGEVIPAELLKKLDESGKYGQGFATVEYVAASLVDLDLHVLTEVPENLDVMAFEQEVLKKRGIPRQIFPRYRVTNFSHTMGGGYTAGYYSYMWAEVLDCDAFEAFKESGDIFNPELAKSFRENCLAKGGIDEGMEMYKNFRGKEPSVDALLRKRGLK